MKYVLVVPVFAFASFSCSASEPDEMLVDEQDSIDVLVPIVAMPSFPLAQPGQLAVATSHREDHYVVHTAWDAWVGRCVESGMVQVIVRTESYGAAVVIAPASLDSGSMTLPILSPTDSAPPDSSARVALQFYPEDRAYVLKGVDGTVEIDSLTSFLSGRFATRVVEATYRDTVYAAATFTSLPIEVVGDEYCRAIDSPPPTVPGEGLEPKPLPVGQVGDNG